MRFFREVVPRSKTHPNCRVNAPPNDAFNDAESLVVTHLFSLRLQGVALTAIVAGARKL